MCGIVGSLRFNSGRPLPRDVVVAMCDYLGHRGPDGSGIWNDGDDVVLGHRRLAIIDLTPSASQPMVTPDGAYALVFNGEIYNHAELRRELESEGIRDWRTDHSDTEVLLYAWRRWGVDCLPRLRGMFAFALWDRRAKSLWLVRDRIGVKPLYYSARNGRLSFASEIKALLIDPDQPRAIDEEALFHFLSLMTTPAPFTLFEGIRKLPGGCWLRADVDGNIEERRYWDAWDEAAPAEHTEDEWVDLLRQELETAVRDRGVADVPVGVFLSGGVDSSANAALFAQTQNRQIKTFSIGYEGEHASYQNEFAYASLMAKRVGSEHHELRLTLDDLVDFVPRMVHLQDEPIADPVCVPLYYVSKLARDNGVIVAQVGEGADELFAGYPRWHQILRLQRLTRLLPGMAAKLGRSALAAAGRAEGQFSEILHRIEAGEPFFSSGAEAFTSLRKQKLLSPRMRAAFHGRSSAEVVEPIMRRFQDRAWEQSPLNWMTFVDLNLRLPELLLMRVDKMSMGVSVECRVPYLDPRIVGLALSMPTQLKLKNGVPKYMLKRAVAGLVPDELIQRKKQGFGVPIHEWTLDRLGPVMREEINGFLAATDYFNSAYVDELFRRQDGTSLWWLYNLAAWHRHFIREFDTSSWYKCAS